MFPNHQETVEIKGVLPLITLNVDELKISLAIRNLIDNAQKYASSDDKIQVSSEIMDDILKINVKDFGPGINSTNIEKLTTPFYRIIKEGGE